MTIELTIEYFEENGCIVALCPNLQVSSFGDTLEEAEQSIQEALELFFEGCEIQNTMNDVLQESGFQKVNGVWIDRDPIKISKTIVQHPLRTVTNANRRMRDVRKPLNSRWDSMRFKRL